MMKVKLVTDINDLSIPKNEWDEAVNQNETNTIFQTYDWFKCWWSIFGPAYSLFIILIFENDKIMGIAPMAIDNSSRRNRKLVFIGDGNSDYLDFIITEQKNDVLHEIFNTINKHSQDWDSLILGNIPTYSTTTGLISALSQSIGLYCSIQNTIVCPTLVIKDRETEAKNIVNKYSTKRPYNYFKRSGTLDHRIINDSNQLTEELERFFTQHIERWKNTPYPSLFLNDKNKEFYRLLAKTILPKKRLLFSVIEHNGNPISYHYGFDYNASLIWYKPSYSLDYSKKSPGILMIRYLINYALENKKSELDFTIGDESFKKRFTNSERYNSTLIVYNRLFPYSILKLKNLAKHVLQSIIRH